MNKAKREKMLLILVAVLYITGASFIFYPTFSNIINRERNLRIIASYESALEEADETDLESMLTEAKEYNRVHKRNYVKDAFSEGGEYFLSEPYAHLLDPQGTGVMGYLEIPGINETLAIYHGTGTEALENGAGHIEGTSLPVGGEGTHAVLAAHRGLPAAKLFTNIDRLEAGDLFYLHVLGDTLAYQVDRILTVDPENIDSLKIEEGEDLVTLLTCTPYGVNTKRLLVRGHRVPLAEQQAEFPAFSAARPVYLVMLIASLTAVLMITAVMILKQSRREKNV